jgi:DNA repair protein RecO (recombination protein O)
MSFSQQGKTEALILDSRDVYDADRIYLLYTREFGKIWARAKGVRKPTSKLTGHLLTYIPVQLELVRAGQGYVITQAQVSDASSSPYPENVLPLTHAMAIVAEVIDGLSAEHDPQPHLYDVLAEGTALLRKVAGEAEGESEMVLLLAELHFKLLSLLGYHPELDHCVVTDTEIREERLGWSDALGGIVAEIGLSQAGTPCVPLEHPRVVLVLRQFAKPGFHYDRLRVDAEVQRESARIVFGYVQYQLGRALKALPFLER